MRSMTIWPSPGLSKIKAARSGHSAAAPRIDAATSRGTTCRIAVAPSGVFTTAPLLTMAVTGQGSRSRTGCAKPDMRPVTMATSTPASTAAQIASRLRSGSCQRVSSSVPSMSMATRRIIGTVYYSGLAEASGLADWLGTSALRPRRFRRLRVARRPW